MSNPKYFVVSDCGTSSTKSMIFNSEGRSLDNATIEIKFTHPQPSWAEQNSEDVYNAVIVSTRELVNKTGIDRKKICAISISGQMGSQLGIDENLKAVTPLVSWIDGRCTSSGDAIREQYKDKLLDRTGSSAYSHMPIILWWKNERPEVFEKITKFTPVGTYVAARLAGLSGLDAFMDPGYFTYSGLNDVRTLTWSNEICDIFGIPMAKLARIVEPWEVVGKLTKRAAEDCDLAEGIPIVAGTGDHPATAFGAGINETGMCYDISGTANIFGVCVDSCCSDKTLSSMKSVVPNLWYSFGTLIGGGCLRWFRDNFILSAGLPEKGTSIYESLAQKAKQIPHGCDGLFFVPHLGGRVNPIEPNIRGLWVGFSWGHNQSHFYRSILESVAYEYSYFLDIMKYFFRGKLEISGVTVVGGGSAKTELWNQIKADVLGLPYVQINQNECSLLGLSVIAGYAIGIHKNLAATIGSMIEKTVRTEPSREHHQNYIGLCRTYERILKVYQENFGSLVSS